MAQTNRIMTYVLEEHNEAFLIWNHAVNKKLISESKNTLLHIDEHFDMAVPRTKESIENIRYDMNGLINYTYNELSVNSFIVPALYQGIFNKVIWVKKDFSDDVNFKQKRCVRSFNREGKKFVVFNPAQKPSGTNMDIQEYKVFRCSPYNLAFLNNNNVVLDINLSYFFCIKEPSEYRVNYIEITEKEYNEFNENSKYHMLKYELLGHRIETKEENGKYYYVLNDHEEIYSFNGDIPDNILVKQVRTLISKLKSYRFIPKLITVSKSVKSGYLTEKKAVVILDELLVGLKSIYNIDIKDIQAIHNKYTQQSEKVLQ